MSLHHEVKHPAENQDIFQDSFSCYSTPRGSCQPFQVFLLGVTNLPRVINDIDSTEGTQELRNYCRSHKFCTENLTLKKIPNPHTNTAGVKLSFSYILTPNPFPSPLLSSKALGNGSSLSICCTFTFKKAHLYFNDAVFPFQEGSRSSIVVWKRKLIS